MRRASQEQGFVLITAIILLAAMLGLGIALVAYTNSQQAASSREQAGEAAFNVAEAALNAQIAQISREWPGVGTEVTTLQEACTPSTYTASNYCPEPGLIEEAYPNTGSASCTGTEAWGSPLTNQWTTYVREDLNGSTYFNSADELTANNFDYGHEVDGSLTPWNKLWVRAVGVVDCHAVAVVSLVSLQLLHASFPESAFSANWFKTGNNGNKIIIEHGGEAQNGKFTIRCNGFTEKEVEEEKCEKYRRQEENGGHVKEGQIRPELTEEEQEPSSISSTTLSSEQLESLKLQAKSEGHFFAPPYCPTSKYVEAIAGRPVYVEGCELDFTGGTANSADEPGFLTIANGTLTLAGSAVYYGIVYDANLQESSEIVVRIGGRAKIVGEIIVDGDGGIEVGEKGNEVVAFEYDPGAAENFQTVVGAAGTRNSFRILPANQ
jgi:Tfp pilus assembly protein PilX